MTASACRHLLGAGPKQDPLESAIGHVAAGKGSPRDLALAGFAAYLLDSDAKKAASLFEEAARAGDVWGIEGQLELARRALDKRQRIRLGFKICELSPRHPLCAVAARAALAGVGDAIALDKEIEASAFKILSLAPEGDAAFFLRLAIAATRGNAGDDIGALDMLAEAGSVNSATLLGPYSKYHYLEWDSSFPPDSGDLSGGTVGPYGRVIPRGAASFDGRFTLYAEPTSADIAYWATDFVVPEKSAYQIRVSSRITHRIMLDGEAILERRDFEAWLPEEQVTDVQLKPGRHRLIAKTARSSEQISTIRVAISRADGKPAKLIFSPASGPPPSNWHTLPGSQASNTGAKTVRPERGVSANQASRQRAHLSFPDTDSLAQILAPEAGDLVAGFIAARNHLEHDNQSAKATAQTLIDKRASAPLLVLRGETDLYDSSLQSRVARGKANRDFEKALEIDPNEASVLHQLSIQARSEGRFDDAAALLQRAGVAASANSWEIPLAELYLNHARGAESLAEDAAKRALSIEAGVCSALTFRYDLARRLDAVAATDSLVNEMAGCPGHYNRKADYLKLRGDLSAAQELYEKQASRMPMDPNPLQSIAKMALAQNKPHDAATIYERLSLAWPYSAFFQRRLGEALEQSGDLKAARAAKERALGIDGADLRLRRSLAVEDKKEVLDDLRTESAQFLERFKSAPSSNSPASYILDTSAAEAYDDGSYTERIHILAKVHNERGISLMGEIHLPAGAELLTLRTIKPNGRVLEPEAIAGKDSISLTGLEVGDLVEYEYLAAHASRGPALPGFATSKFYFRIAEGQLFHSALAVRAPRGNDLVVDVHGLPDSAKIVRDSSKKSSEKGGDSSGQYELVKIELNDVPAFVSEPQGPGNDELLPFVQVGYGASTEELITGFGDMLANKAKPTREIFQFAEEAAAGATGLAAVRAVYAKVMQEIKGPDDSLTTPASTTLSQGRGNRLVLLKAALDVLGIESRVVLVRTFSNDQASYRFPAANLFGNAALQVVPAKGEPPILLAPGTRFAPFGVLAPQAADQQAAVLPQVGERARFIRTPAGSESDEKRVELRLSLDVNVNLSGDGEERYEGYEAASVKSVLEPLSPDQRRQAVESAVARTFDNASLTDYSVAEKEEPGAPVVLKYSFRAEGFARSEQGRLLISRGIYTSGLGRRFLALSERRTPLLISSPEKTSLSVRISLPDGMGAAGQAQSDKLDSPFGHFERAEKRAPGSIEFKENLSIAMSRIAPDQYVSFSEFVQSIDKIQGREIVVESLASSADSGKSFDPRLSARAPSAMLAP